MRLLARAIASLAILFAFQASPALALDKIRLGTSWIALLWTFIQSGMKAGTWQKYGIEVERVEFAGDANMQQALASRSIDFGFGSGPGMAYHSKGVPAIAVAAVAGPPYSFAVMVRPQSPIKTPDDLKGKKVGVTTEGSVTQWLIRELSRQKGWGPQGITDLPLGSIRTQFVSLKSGELDASVTTAESTYTYEGQGEGRLLLLFGDIVRDFHTHVAFAQVEHIEKNPDLVTRFLKAWFATVAHMKANPDFAIKEGAALMNYPEDIIRRAMDGQMRMLSDDGAFSPAAVEKISKSLVELHLLEQEPPRNEMFTDRFVPVKP